MGCATQLHSTAFVYLPTRRRDRCVYKNIIKTERTILRCKKRSRKLSNVKLLPSAEDVFNRKMRTASASLRHCQHNTHRGEKVNDTGARCDQNNAK